MAELAAELGVELPAAGEPEVVARPRHHYSWHPPRWLPLALVVGAAIWAAGIWWMFGHTGSSEPVHDHAAALSDEVATFNEKVDGLSKQVAALGQERDALAQRVAALEARPIAPTAATPGTTAPAVVQMDLRGASSAPRAAYPPYEAAPFASTTAGTSRYFTNGVDRYNCSSFASQAEAQEALAANVPGDPNRLDMNGNGVACEDITYAANAPKNLTPVAGRYGPAASVESGAMPAQGVDYAQRP